ncbi:MAG: hypothetical protein KAS17_02590 [Victivallaceae bacterium]|nr:hypothetical protein [Victivallaceae bacterium]
MSCRLKLSVGYFLPDKYSICDCIEQYGKHIGEVYFPVKDVPGGRGISIFGDAEGREMLAELKEIKSAGRKLNMLWNANCYGGEALSQELAQKVKRAIDKVCIHVELEIVTTSSLFIASVIKDNFKGIEVRASVNMDIGSRNQMRYVENYFDSFCISRSLNRDKNKLKELSDYAHSSGKKIYMLANSGCLLNCPAHAFHDNLVAHEHEISKYENLMQFKGVCWDFYRENHTKKDFKENSTWVLPEQIDDYTGIDGIKLATRVHRNPGMVIEAYAQRQYDGNVLGLMEPDFSSLGIVTKKDIFHD